MTQANGSPDGAERQVIRFEDLNGRESPFHPFDMVLERFQRRRYAVVGRRTEKTATGSGPGEVDDFSVVYIAAAPGKGIGSHAHATPEVFIVMGGESPAELEVGPWDVVAVPPDVFHSAVNIGETEGWILAINTGGDGAPIQWDPALIAEIRAQGLTVEATELPGAALAERP